VRVGRSFLVLQYGQSTHVRHTRHGIGIVTLIGPVISHSLPQFAHSSAHRL
jgi:hypothetical protein